MDDAAGDLCKCAEYVETHVAAASPAPAEPYEGLAKTLFGVWMGVPMDADGDDPAWLAVAKAAVDAILPTDSETLDRIASNHGINLAASKLVKMQLTGAIPALRSRVQSLPPEGEK